jgi:hypothetical protein
MLQKKGENFHLTLSQQKRHQKSSKQNFVASSPLYTSKGKGLHGRFRLMNNEKKSIMTK